LSPFCSSPLSWQHTFSLAGDIDLEVGLSPTLVVEDVSFQNATWGSRPELAKLKHFEIQIALLPLILKRIAVKRIVLVSPDILVETDSSGTSNLDFETEEGGEPQEPEESSSAASTYTKQPNNL
jgi:uncharacterized protein involved in outer membrane biogenesis